jgi:hypothetical protein
MIGTMLGGAAGIIAAPAVGGLAQRGLHPALRPWEQHFTVVHLPAWSTNMAWAFTTNVPTPNLDRRPLFPLALTSPIYLLAPPRQFRHHGRPPPQTPDLIDEGEGRHRHRRAGHRCHSHAVQQGPDRQGQYLEPGWEPRR